MQVLRATGVEAESELAFAGVHQLVWPLLDTLDEIPARQAAALRGALGLDAPAGDDRFLIGAAVLSLLAFAAESSPVLCLVDDANWLDTASADALTFAARRLNADPIGVVFAARDDDVRASRRRPPRAARRGLDEARRATCSPSARLPGGRGRGQLVAIASGNPLALLELPRAQRGPARRPHPAQRRRCPSRARSSRPSSTACAASQAGRSLMLLAAADDTAEPAVVLRAATALGIDSAALDDVERTGLVQFGERDVRFRHSLVRSAVYQGASFGERRRAHQALTEALDEERHADRRVWHRAAATLGADDELADELERSAEGTLTRGGHVAAAAALERAAAFTSDSERPRPPAAAAASAAWLGRTARRRCRLAPTGAAARVGAADPSRPGAPPRADRAATRARLRGRTRSS